jgi:sugar phosphate isomerase/epimerase
MDIDKFISKVRDRTIYLHAHNNNGEKDEHTALDKGTLDWEHVLDLLDLSKIRKIVIEARPGKDIRQSEKLLKQYLKKRG